MTDKFVLYMLNDTGFSDIFHCFVVVQKQSHIRRYVSVQTSVDPGFYKSYIWVCRI